MSTKYIRKEPAIRITKHKSSVVSKDRWSYQKRKEFYLPFIGDVVRESGVWFRDSFHSESILYTDYSKLPNWVRFNEDVERLFKKPRVLIEYNDSDSETIYFDYNRDMEIWVKENKESVLGTGELREL